jgi:hypothetical protein
MTVYERAPQKPLHFLASVGYHSNRSRKVANRSAPVRTAKRSGGGPQTKQGKIENMQSLTLDRLRALTCSPDGKDTLTTFKGGVSVRCYQGAEEPGGLAHKIFWARFSLGGKKHGVKIGRADVVSIAVALKAAKEIHGDVAKGKNPAQERREAARAAKRKADEDALTLGKLLDRWNAIALAGNRASYRRGALRALRRAFKDRLARPAAELTKAAVIKTLDGLTEAGAPVMATRTMAYGRACFGWGVRRGMLETNPFTGIPIAAATERDRVLSDDELGAVLRTADASTTFGGIVWLLTLTGASGVTGWVLHDLRRTASSSLALLS